ncbi:SH3 domain-containing protein [Streptomyces sp. NPDC089424]|uniref:SH3 domain-containing protein n=1 Tax=Streptomyces sp. NPDC089424 TaxID=3365917 RepID=UPI00380A6D9D
MATENIEIAGAGEQETAPTALAEPGTPAGTETLTATEDATATATARVRAYPVAPGVRLNVRSGPGTDYRIVRVLPEGTTVPIYCQRPGDSVTGPYGTSNLWDCIANSQYVSDAYVKTGSDGYVAPRCA